MAPPFWEQHTQDSFGSVLTGVQAGQVVQILETGLEWPCRPMARGWRRVPTVVIATSAPTVVQAGHKLLKANGGGTLPCRQTAL